MAESIGAVNNVRVAVRSARAVAGADSFHRVVRGGSFDNNDNNARAACRNRNNPTERNNNVGFRVVVSRSPSASRVSRPRRA